MQKPDILLHLEHLRTFFLAAETGSFTKAAVALGVAQPTVSRIISELEKHWGGVLFYRTGRGVALSELGVEALSMTQDLLKSAEQMSEHVRSLGGLPRGQVSLAIPPSLTPIILPPLFSELRKERPGITLRIIGGFGEDISKLAMDGAVDIGVYSKYRESSGADTTDDYAGLVLVGAPRARLFPPVTRFSDLGSFPLVLGSQKNSLRTLIDSVARKKKVALNIVAETNSIVAQKELILKCECYSIMELQAVNLESEAKKLLLSKVINPSIGREIIVATGHKTSTRAANDVINRVNVIIKRHHWNHEQSGNVCCDGTRHQD